MEEQQLSKEIKKVKHPIIRLIRTLFFAFLIFFSLILIATGILYFKRDYIGEKILLHSNDLQNGVLSFSEISFNPFVHFPYVSVHLHDLVYHEVPVDSSALYQDTIAQFNHFYAALHLLDLTRGDINISKITISGGNFCLIKNKDKSTNLSNALGLNADVVALDTIPKNDTIDRKFSSFLQFSQVTLKNIVFTYLAESQDEGLEVLINELKTSFTLDSDTVQSRLIADLFVNQFRFGNDLIFTDKTVMLNTDMLFDQGKNILHIYQGDVKLDNFKFKVNGDVNISNEGSIDVKVMGSEEGFGIFKFLLTDLGLRNLKSGSSYFEGTVIGSFIDQIPEIKISFGLNNVNIHIPEIKQNISDLNLEGYFNSGTNEDFSSACLNINKLQGNLPGGYINGVLVLENFISPHIEYFLDIETNVTGFDEIFNLAGIQNIDGHVKLKDEFTGSFDKTSQLFIEEKSNSSIELDSLSFSIPDIIKIRNITGRLIGNKDTITIENLDINTSHSDLRLSGQVSNLSSIWLRTDEEIFADLRLDSDTFDFPQFFAFAPIVGQSFPYRLLDVDLHLKAETNTQKLLNFSFNPEIIFHIDEMNGVIEDLLPKIEISQGDVFLTEKNNRIYMEFQNFILNVENAVLKPNVVYFSPPVEPDYISIEVLLSDFNPGEVLLYKSDSIPSIADGILSGFISANLEIGLDTLDFETFNVLTGELSYTTETDTFDFNQLSIDANNILFGQGTPGQSMADISFEARIMAVGIYSNLFELDEVNFEVSAEKGNFTIYPKKIPLFGKDGKGYFELSPFAEVPVYKLKYSVESFQIEDLPGNLMEDSLLTGEMHLDIELVNNAMDYEMPFAGLNGYINIIGTNLVLHGLDIDKLIKRYQRSQKFNLIDLGAVVVTGPYALVLTKGTNFAQLALGGPGESSTILKFMSNWDLQNGRMFLNDVAFSTKENRIAGTGWIDLPSDSLDVTFAVLDKNGCSVLSQNVFGSIQDPQYSEVKIVGTVLGPITNLIDGALGKDCEVFYDGHVFHPDNKK